MIEVKELSKKYGPILAVDDLNFSVEKGEIVGFLGPNGAGKSTTMNILTGYLSYSKGSVKVCGYDVMEEPREVKRRIGYLPELPPLYMDMTVVEYLEYVSELKLVEKSIRNSRLDDIMELVKITDVRGRLIKNLSKGYKQRVGLAQAIIGNPEVVILDEPTVGLDPKQIIEIRKLIKSFGKDHTIILSSHILPEVSAICERVLIINKGKIVASDTPENLSKLISASSKLKISIKGEPETIIERVKQIEGVKYVEASTDNGNDIKSYIVEAQKDLEIRESLFFALSEIKAPIYELSLLNDSLEDVFLKLTGEESLSLADQDVSMDENLEPQNESQDESHEKEVL